MTRTLIEAAERAVEAAADAGIALRAVHARQAAMTATEKPLRGSLHDAMRDLDEAARAAEIARGRATRAIAALRAVDRDAAQAAIAYWSDLEDAARLSPDADDPRPRGFWRAGDTFTDDEYDEDGRYDPR